MSESASQTVENWVFSYHGCDFHCSVDARTPHAYLSRVVYRSGALGAEQTALPIDAEPYASAAEAKRHAEQQAVRWVHDRTGDGKGRF